MNPHNCWVKFCADCDQGFICLSRKAQRCPLCANARAVLLSRARVDLGARDRARKSRQQKPEQYRAAERRRAAAKRQANPELYRGIVRRYQARRREQAEPGRVAREEHRLMEQATREVVADLRRAQTRAARASEVLRPTPCAYCGELFTPEQVTPRRQIYCNPTCNRWAASLRKKIARSAAAGRL